MSSFFHAFVSKPIRSGLAPSSSEAEYVNAALSIGSVLRSLKSCPAIAAKMRAQSSAERASGPILSIEYESAIAPYRLTRPYVGRNPLTPQSAAGQTIEPQVSVPMANAASPAPTIAPEPEEEPHVQQEVFQGFFDAPCSDAEA